MSDSNHKSHQRGASLIEELRQSSRTWSIGEWESYLSSLESPLRETLTKKYDDLAESIEAPDPNAPTLSELAAERLQRAINQLSPKQKLVIQSKYWDGLSEHEIASREGISRTTVQMHLARAITRLEKLMSSKFPLSEGIRDFFTYQARPVRTNKTLPAEGEDDE